MVRLKIRFIQWLHYIIGQEHSTHKLAFALCLGNYIAFSPYIGFHGIMAVGLAWLTGLSISITFAAAYGINNPFTAIPIYGADYLFGYWFTHSLCKLNVAAITPLWLEKCAELCQQRVGIPFPCIWSFLLGGNILGILTSVALYPVARWFIVKYQKPS